MGLWLTFSDDSFRNADSFGKETPLYKNVLLRLCLELLWLVKWSKHTIVCLKRKSLILTSCLVNSCRKSITFANLLLLSLYKNYYISYQCFLVGDMRGAFPGRLACREKHLHTICTTLYVNYTNILHLMQYYCSRPFNQYLQAIVLSSWFHLSV